MADSWPRVWGWSMRLFLLATSVLVLGVTCAEEPSLAPDTVLPLKINDDTLRNRTYWQKVERLVFQLGHKTEEVRDRAQRELEAAPYGWVAYMLKKHSNHENEEIRRRIKSIRDKMECGVEVAYDEALFFLAYNQEDDGHWDLMELGGDAEQELLVTALSALAFLGAGHSEKIGTWKSNVRTALRYIRGAMADDGSIGVGGKEVDGLTHAFCSLALVAACDLGPRPEARKSAQQSLDYAFGFQRTKDGRLFGFGREPRGADCDLLTTTVFAMLHFSAMNAKPEAFSVPTEVSRGIERFLDALDDTEKKAFRERLAGTDSVRSTIFGCAARMFLGRRAMDLREYLKFRHEHITARELGDDAWGSFFGTCFFFAAGGDDWRRWNDELKRSFLSSQIESGNHQTNGSWNSNGQSASGKQLGRVGTTAIRSLTLEVYYGYLPFYRMLRELANGRALSPAVRSLVAQLGNPNDSVEREKGLNGLLALGAEGVAVLREEFSCKGAKTTLETSVDKQVVRPGGRVSFKASLKTEGSGVLWIPNIANPRSFLGVSDSTVNGFGENRPHIEFKIAETDVGYFGERTVKAIETSPIQEWKPIKPGETISELSREVVIEGIGHKTLTATSRLDATPPVPFYPKSLDLMDPVAKQRVTLKIGAEIGARDLQPAARVEVFGLPDLNALPGNPRLQIEVKPRSPRMDPNEFQLEATVALRSLAKDTALIIEQDAARYAWVMWLDQESVPLEWWSWNAVSANWGQAGLVAQRLTPGNSCQWTIRIPRPEHAGTFRLLVGYQVSPGGTKIAEQAPPVYTPHGEADGMRIQNCEILVLSDPILVEPPNVREWRPRDDLPPLTIKGKVTEKDWRKGIEVAEIFHQREVEVTEKEFLQEKFAPVLFFTNELPDGDIRKVATFFHCGVAFLRQSQCALEFRPFNSPYLDYCAAYGVKLAEESLLVDDALRTGCCLLQASVLLLRGRTEMAHAALDRLEPALRANREHLHWDWVYFVDAQSRCLTAEGKSEAALKLIEENLPWLERELGPNNDGLLLLLPKAVEIAQKIGRKDRMVPLEGMLNNLEKSRDTVGLTMVELFEKRLAHGKDLAKAGKMAEAENVLQEAATMARYVSYSEAYEQLATIELQSFYRAQRRYDLALKYARRVLAYHQRSATRNPFSIGVAEAEVSKALLTLGKRSEGQRYLRRAVKSLECAHETKSSLYRELKQQMAGAR